VTGEPSRSALAAADLPVTVSVTRQIRKGSERLARELLRDAIDRASGFPGVRRQLFFPINDNYFYRSGSGAGLPVPPFSAVRGVWARST